MSSIIDDMKSALQGVQIDYTTEDMSKSLMILAVPLVLEMMLQSIFEIVDIFFVGKLGATAIAAVGLVSSVIVLIIGVGLGLGIATSSLIAQYMGQKNLQAAQRVAVYSIICTTLCGIAISVFGVFYSSDILMLMNADSKVIEEGVGYCTIAIGGAPILLLSIVNNSILRGAGDSSLSLRMVAFSNTINLILDPILIFGFWIFPSMGLIGAAVATLIGRTVGVVYQFLVLFRGISRLKIQQIPVPIDGQILYELVRKSATGMFQSFVGTASWMMIIRIVAMFGSVTVAGFVIMIRISLFVLLPAIGLANAATTLVGQNLGAEQKERASDAVWLTGKANVILMIPLIFVLCFFAEYWVSIFTTDPEVLKTGRDILQITSVGILFWGLGSTMNNSLNGSGDIQTPTRINIICFWFVQIPLAYLLSKHIGWEGIGVAWAIVCADTTFFLCGCFAVTRTNWFSFRNDRS